MARPRDRSDTPQDTVKSLNEKIENLKRAVIAAKADAASMERKSVILVNELQKMHLCPLCQDALENKPDLNPVPPKHRQTITISPLKYGHSNLVNEINNYVENGWRLLWMTTEYAKMSREIRS